MTSSSSQSKQQPKISIGLAVYNGELFIRRAVDSLLGQTFTDFEIIISDNASTDSTPEICKEYLKKDKRIRYYRQKRNIGIHRNFNFLLKQARYHYFSWAAVDDYLDPDFMEKNLKILESNKNIVSSIGKIKPYGSDFLDIDPKSIDTTKYPDFIKNYVKKGRHKKMIDTVPVYGPFEKKIRFFLKHTKSLGRFYGVHRTEQLRKCIVETPFINVEVSTFINLLKLGDFHEVPQTTLYEFDEGISSRGIINMAKYSEHDFLGIIFPLYSFTNWCFKNLGLKIFFRNLDYFIRLNLGGGFALLVDSILHLKNNNLKFR